MSHSQPLRRLLAHPPSRAKALEFLRAVFAEGNSRLVPRSGRIDDPLKDLIREAKLTPHCIGALEMYLVVDENRKFAKTLIVFLISSIIPFQPNRIDDWSPFQKIIDEILGEGLAFVGGPPTGPEDPCELLLDDLGASFIERKLHELGA